MNNQLDIFSRLEQIKKEIPSSWRQLAMRIGITYPTIHNFIHGEQVSLLTLEKMNKYIKDYEKSTLESKD